MLDGLKELFGIEETEAAARCTPLTEVLFTSTELFTLLGQADAGRFVTPHLPKSNPTPSQLEKWKQQTIEHLRPLDLADGNCVVAPELSALLEPLKTGTIVIHDNRMPDYYALDTDKRTFSIQGTRERGTLVRLVEEDGKRLFTLQDVGPLEDWVHLFEASYQWHLLKPSQFDLALAQPEKDEDAIAMIVAMANGSETAARQFIEMHGLSDTRPLLTLKDIRDAQAKGLLNTMHLEALDLSDGALPVSEDEPFGYVQPKGEGKRRFATIYPEFGFSISACFARRDGMPDDWAVHETTVKEASFAGFDWIPEHGLVDHLINIPDYPEHLETSPWTAPDPGKEPLEETTIFGNPVVERSWMLAGPTLKRDILIAHPLVALVSAVFLLLGSSGHSSATIGPWEIESPFHVMGWFLIIWNGLLWVNLLVNKFTRSEIIYLLTYFLAAAIVFVLGAIGGIAVIIVSLLFPLKDLFYVIIIMIGLLFAGASATALSLRATTDEDLPKELQEKKDRRWQRRSGTRDNARAEATVVSEQGDEEPSVDS